MGNDCRGEKGFFTTYLRQIILSQLYFWASCLREGSIMPPRRRSTRWRVDSIGGQLEINCNQKHSFCVRQRDRSSGIGSTKCYLSGCCNQTECVHPPTVCQRRSGAADQGGFLHRFNSLEHIQGGNEYTNHVSGKRFISIRRLFSELVGFKCLCWIVHHR